MRGEEPGELCTVSLVLIGQSSPASDWLTRISLTLRGQKNTDTFNMILLRAASLRPSVSHTRALDLDDSLSLGLKMGGAGEGQPRLSLLR